MRAMTLRSTLLLAGALAIPQAASAQDLEVEEGDSRPVRDTGMVVEPYIEAAQVLSMQLEPFEDTVTYTRLAAGVDAGLSGRNSAASISVRYERTIGYEDNFRDSDTISGVARGSLALVPRRVTIEAGALASRTSVESGGATSVGRNLADVGNTSQVYSAYAGPSVQTNVGDLAVTGAYRIGYTRVEAPDAVILAPGEEPVDIFDDSVSQAANVRAGFAPRTALPIGVGVGAGWNRQDISNLDQRVDDRYVRGDVTVPVSPTLALVGGVGYEQVEVSARDAVRDASGDPVIGPDGRFVTNDSAPRVIAYETEGLIWDAGVMWKPSRRTALQAVVGRRYDSTTYYGSLSYAPNARTNFNVGVYDNVTGFGGVVVDGLAGLSTDFDAFRNPITGDLTGCVVAVEGNGCTLANLGSLRSAVFRNRGGGASLTHTTGRTTLGIAGGYDKRTFIAAAGTPIEAFDGIADENIWLAAFAAQQLDNASGVQANAYINWFDSGFDSGGNGTGYSAALSYYRNIVAGLTGTAAVGIDGIDREDPLPDSSAASALLGLRYTF